MTPRTITRLVDTIDAAHVATATWTAQPLLTPEQLARGVRLQSDDWWQLLARKARVRLDAELRARVIAAFEQRAAAP